MTDLNLDSRIRDILQRNFPSNDNASKSATPLKKPSDTEGKRVIYITGNNNIVIEANSLYTTFLFLLACFWMYLCNN